MIMKVKSQKSKVKNCQRGFTLIEIMVVVVIIGLLVAIVSPRIMVQYEKARVTQTKTQIRNLEQTLKLFKLDCGFYPSTEQGLKALVEKPTVGKIPTNYTEGGYLEKGKVPLDAWGNPFIYLSPGLYEEYDIISLGGDGKEGGESFDEDLYSWDME
jgi:general secretion pathway protein G